MHHVFKTIGGLTATLPSDSRVRLVQSFNAPRPLVWDAHTQPALLRRWLLGPPGWTMPVCEVDLRVGGKYRYEWHGEQGMAMGLSGTYTDIAAPERISDRQMFDDDWTGGPYESTLVLTEADGKTVLTLDIVYASKESRDLAMSTPMLEGMEAGYERLENLAL